MGVDDSRLRNAKAILFDLHETLTEVHESILAVTRRIAHDSGIDLAGYSDDELNQALEKTAEWFTSYQIDHDVDIRFGSEVEHWNDANRMMFEELGIDGLSDEVLLSVELRWKEELKTWEFLRPEVKSTLFGLYERGYQLGICTRRVDDPTDLLREWEIHDILSTVHWSSVPGYSKPYPYTLIMAASEIGVNPLRCVFVGNSVESDIAAAHRAGMLPVLTIWADAEQLKRAPKRTIIINDISDLLNLLDGQPE
jgi:phosphoglycolate phosphatase